MAAVAVAGGLVVALRRRFLRFCFSSFSCRVLFVRLSRRSGTSVISIIIGFRIAVFSVVFSFLCRRRCFFFRSVVSVSLMGAFGFERTRTTGRAARTRFRV